MITTSKRAVLYARFSSDNQRSESIDAQIRAMKSYCDYNNIAIIDTYIDEAKSATTAQRPAFQKMIADSKSHNFDVVLVHKLDRFARNRYDSALAKRELKRNGVAVYSVLENLDDSPESIMMEAVLEGMSEYYSQNLAREVMKGMLENALQCKHTGGKPPLGYDVDLKTRKLIVNEEEAKAVRLIFEMYADGKGYNEILDELFARNYKTKTGNNFLKNSLYGILTNHKYKGTYVYNKSSSKASDGTRNSHMMKHNEDVIAVEGGCPQLIDDETFNKVHKRIADNRHTAGRMNAKHRYLLSGKIFCRECGKAMVGNARFCGRGKRLYITYKCPTKRHSCSNKEINRNYLEKYVVDLLESEIFNATAIKEIAKEIKSHQRTDKEVNQKKIEELKLQLTETNNAITNITEIIVRGQRFDSLIDKLAELEEKKGELEIEILKATSEEVSEKSADDKLIDIKHIPSAYAKVKENVFSNAYKEFIQDFITKIDVGKYNIGITLKTGLEICPSLDKKLNVGRKEVYQNEVG